MRAQVKIHLITNLASGRELESEGSIAIVDRVFLPYASIGRAIGRLTVEALSEAGAETLKISSHVITLVYVDGGKS